MRNYLDYAENQANELGYEMDGVRVYYAAYPENDESEHAGQATMFIVPTGNVSDNAKNGNMLRAGNGDIPGSDPLNDSNNGYPPEANYPQ